jgi:zinc ribbon protein
MSAVAHSCPSCGSDLPVGARFCASCGARTASAGRAVTWSTAERRYFGVFPGRSFVAAVRGRVRRWLAVATGNLRLALAVVRAQVRAGVEGFRLRREGARVERERSRELHALGEATYRGDRKQASLIRARIGELETRMESLQESLREVDRRTNEQIARAHMEGGPTNIVEPEPSPAPEPPIVPEPEPVPSDPPGPVIVPEPEPVPHEPPGPVIVPEPEPPTGG